MDTVVDKRLVYYVDEDSVGLMVVALVFIGWRRGGVAAKEAEVEAQVNGDSGAAQYKEKYGGSGG